MTQKAGPRSDDVNFNWVPAVLWPELNKPAAADEPFVSTVVANPLLHYYFQVKLAPIAWPRPGPQTITIRVAQSEPALFSLSLTLYCGSTEILSRIVDASPEFENVVIALTDAEKALITNYANLYVKFGVLGIE